MKKFSILFAFLGVFAATQAKPPSHRQSELQKFFDNLKNTKYNKDIMPEGTHGDGTPVLVNFTMYIIDIHKLDTHDQEYEMTYYFRQSWMDNRLAYPNLDIKDHISLKDGSFIWTPDMFFVNAKSSKIHDVVDKNMFVRIKRDGTAFLSNRITSTFRCHMTFNDFPHDVQKCFFNAESYGHTKSVLTPMWQRKGDIDPVAYAHGIDLSPYKIKTLSTHELEQKVSTGIYQSLQLEIVLERSAKFFVNKLYVPSVFFIALAWASFWIPSSLSALRLALVLATYFLMMQTRWYVSCHVPAVPYATGVDVWIGVTEAFIFVAFLELILVCVLKRTTQKSRSLDPEAPVLLDSSEKQSTKTGNGVAGVMFLARRFKGDAQVHLRVDRVFRVLYPVLLLLFSFVYFLVY